jgi:hypothetical protein
MTDALRDVSMSTMEATSTPILAMVARMAVTELEWRTKDCETLASLVRGYITELEHRVPKRRKRG